MANCKLIYRVNVKWWFKLLYPVWIVQVYLLKQSPYIPKSGIELVKAE